MMGNRKYSSETKIKTIDATETTLSGGIPHLPQDIIEEILVRLPAKTLLRFKCVAKSWLALISSQNFIKAHVTYSTIPPTTFPKYRFMLDVSYDQFHDNVNHDGSVSYDIRDLLTNDVAEDADCPKKQTDWKFRIMGSCNGLLCVSFYRHFLGTIHTFLWNPCLRMSKKLPPIPEEAESERTLYSTYGLSYDEPNDEYKVVVRLSLFFDKVSTAYRIMVNIWSLKNDCWKRIEDFEGLFQPYTSVIYANGKFHFSALFDGEWSIVSLDLENKVYGTIEQPKCDMCYSRSSIAVLKGCISVLYSYAREYADVWVLEEYGNNESWTKLVSIPYRTPSRFKTYPLYCFCMLANGKYLLGHGRQLLVYDPEDNGFIYPACTRKLVNHYPISSMGIYVESLVPLPK